nr:hypothetical protein [Tanacetum cinerariifolium]
EGSSCLEGSGAGLILTSPEGEEFTYALRFEFDASNNEAEYKALVAGLRIEEQIGVENLVAKVDSRLVLRSENKKADALRKIASTKLRPPRQTSLGTLPAETKRARAIKIKARQYSMINDVLYRKSFLEPWLQCVGPVHAEYVVKEIHEGSCSMHSGSRSVVAKAIRSGYYWPTMHKDARNIIRKCPFPEAQGKVKFLIVAIDYFTKFGLPREIISDNGNQFRDNPFKDWREKLDIKQRLEEDNKNWVEEVLHVLWAHRTIIKTSNGDTLFSLTYGTEFVIPVEIGMPSLRCTKVNQPENNEGQLLNLDMLEERREKAMIPIKQATPKTMESWVQNRKGRTKWWKHLEKERTS